MDCDKRQNDSHRTDDALARVSAFLRCLGLPRQCADEHAKAAVENTLRQPGLAAEDCAALALADAMSRFEAWLEYLCAPDTQRIPGDPAGGRGRRALLAWYLRPVLAEHPDLFLRRGDLPEPLRLAVRASAEPLLPEETPAPMPAQALGELPLAFRPGFWRTVAGQFGSAGRDPVGLTKER